MYIVPGGLLSVSVIGKVSSFVAQKSRPPGFTKETSGVFPRNTEMVSYAIHSFCPVTSKVRLNAPEDEYTCNVSIAIAGKLLVVYIGLPSPQSIE